MGNGRLRGDGECEGLGQWAMGGLGAMGSVRVGGIYIKFNY